MNIEDYLKYIHSEDVKYDIKEYANEINNCNEEKRKGKGVIDKEKPKKSNPVKIRKSKKVKN